MAVSSEPYFCRMAAAPYPAYGPCVWLKLSVLMASKSPVAMGRPLCAPCATDNCLRGQRR